MSPLHTLYQAHLVMPLIHHQKLQMRPHLHVNACCCLLVSPQDPRKWKPQCLWLATSAMPERLKGLQNINSVVENLTMPLKQDQLGRLVSSLSSCLASTSSWGDFINEHQGKSYLAPDLNNFAHSAHNYLQKCHDHGMQVPMDDPPWSDETI